MHEMDRVQVEVVDAIEKLWWCDVMWCGGSWLYGGVVWWVVW